MVDCKYESGSIYRVEIGPSNYEAYSIPPSFRWVNPPPLPLPLLEWDGSWFLVHGLWFPIYIWRSRRTPIYQSLRGVGSIHHSVRGSFGRGEQPTSLLPFLLRPYLSIHRDIYLYRKIGL